MAPLADKTSDCRHLKTIKVRDREFGCAYSQDGSFCRVVRLYYDPSLDIFNGDLSLSSYFNNTIYDYSHCIEVNTFYLTTKQVSWHSLAI